MKTRLLLFALLGFIFPIQAQDIIPDLEMWYKFDYKNGDIYLKDYSGNNRHIAPSSNGQARDWTSVQFGTAQIGQNEQSYVYFPAGREDNIYFSNAPEGAYWTGITGGVARTFCAWVKIDPDAAEYDGKYLFSYGNPDAATGGGGYRIELKGKSVEFANAPNTGANNWCNRNVGYLNNFPQNTWHHLALVYGGNGDRQTGFTLYVDGTIVPFDPVAGDSPDYSINTAGLYPPEIGRYMIKMAVADLRFYSKALTINEVNIIKAGNEFPTSIVSPAFKENAGYVSYQNHAIVFVSTAEINAPVSVSVYNVTGQLDMKTEIVGKGAKTIIPYQTVNPGVKIVKIQGNSLNITEKILIK
jgi:hypothetical protein